MAQEMVITRMFDAPREKVWQAWTDPDIIKQWWGPKHFTAPDIQIDLREGGKYLYCMQDPQGNKLWSTGTFHEIVPVEKMVVTDSFADEKGNILEPTQFGMSPDFPRVSRATVTFDEMDGKTKLTIRYAKSVSDAVYKAMQKSGMETGWRESLDKLAKVVKT